MLGADGRERRVPIGELRVGDRFVVRPGEKVAADGIVEEGSSAVDQSLLTGEPCRSRSAPGDEIVGAALNAGGRLVVRATRVGADTALAQIGRLVSEAQSGKAPVQRLADRVSAVFVPVVIGLAAATLAFWLARRRERRLRVHGRGRRADHRLPVRTRARHADGAARRHGSRRPARHPDQGSRGARVDAACRHDRARQDRHGDDGRDAGARRRPRRGRRPRRAAAARGRTRARLEHPVARAIAAAAASEVGQLPAVESFRNHAGRGVEGAVEGRAVVAGRPSLLADAGLALSGELDAARAAAQAAGRTVIAAGWDGEVRGLIVVADAARPSSAAAVAQLEALGLRPVLLTGDNAATAAAIAAEVGIGEVIADVLPAGKAEVIRRLQGEGRVVAMAGDGVNDAPALAQADLGLAVGTGSDVAIEASDITLVSGDLRASADAIRLSRRTLATIKGNLFWAFGYNLAALPLAAAGYLNPLIAGAAMAGSSLLVVSNSLRLRRFQPHREVA